MPEAAMNSGSDAARPATVIAFAGHLIDAPGRPTPRFPATLAPVVAAELAHFFSALGEAVVFTSAANGSDILCIEAALGHGAEVNVVLPFDRQDFIATSVAPGGGDWVVRFDAALTRAARVVDASGGRYGGDDALFERAARLVESLAVSRAAHLRSTPTMLCVLDAGADSAIGGTLGSYERWTGGGRAARVVDLRSLRTRAEPSSDTDRSQSG
jgi:adenylate cyclase